ncbi:MAG: type I glutamate--ammonia ligase [Planctomycetota bacterium]
MTPREVLALCRERDLHAVDLRFMDFPGTQKHFTRPVSRLTEASFEEGFSFDGSGMRGWQAVNESDLLVVPQAETAMVDPFMERTLSLTCTVRDPVTGEDYPKDPRNIARKAERYMRSLGIADEAMIGPEAEFHVFDGVAFDSTAHHSFYSLDSAEGQWARGRQAGNAGGAEPGTGGASNRGRQIRRNDGFFAAPPTDTLQELRSEIMATLEEVGIAAEGHHHEIGSAGQCEVDMRFAPLRQSADNLHRYKYVVKNVAARRGKTATFMPKPLFDDAGNGLHLHLSLWKDGAPLFAGGNYGGLSDTALHALGGILTHAPALFAFCCPTTNSYKRLVPGFEAPVNLTYSYRNRSAAVRIPVHAPRPEDKRFEFRVPDPSCNAHLASAALLMAALDGVQNRIDPGPPLDKDLYDLGSEEVRDVPPVPATLAQALTALRRDHEFLLRGDVFTEDVVDTWIRVKTEHEVAAVRRRPHPHEFTLYYDV